MMLAKQFKYSTVSLKGQVTAVGSP